MAKLHVLCLVLVVSGWHIDKGEGGPVSSEMCQYIQRLIKRFIEDNGKCLVFKYFSIVVDHCIVCRSVNYMAIGAIVQCSY